MPRTQQSLWVWSAGAIEKYRIIVWIIGAALVALGFDFKTPKAQYADLHNEITDTRIKLQSQIDTLKFQTYRLTHDQRLNALIRLKCAELTEQEILRFGVPCKEAEQ